MKKEYLIYNLILNLEGNEKLLNKVISNITNEKLLKKLMELLNDLLSLKNKVYQYMNKNINLAKLDEQIIKQKYDEYKNIMSFL